MFKLISGVADLISFLVFKFFIYSEKSIVLVDIDNTIANTWPTLKNSKKSFFEFERYRNIEPLLASISYIKNLEEKNLIFLSARPFYYWFTTKSWLKSNGFPSGFSNLFLVSKANVKLRFLKYAIEKEIKIKYFDDLSFNHENGQIKFYDIEIDFVKSSNIEYFDFYFINSLNNNFK